MVLSCVGLCWVQATDFDLAFRSYAQEAELLISVTHMYWWPLQDATPTHISAIIASSLARFPWIKLNRFLLFGWIGSKLELHSYEENTSGTWNTNVFGNKRCNSLIVSTLGALTVERQTTQRINIITGQFLLLCQYDVRLERRIRANVSSWSAERAPGQSLCGCAQVSCSPALLLSFSFNYPQIFV